MSKTNSDYWGLLFECPMKKEAHDCEFVQLRQLPLLDRVRFFDDMTTLESEEIIRKHKNCLTGREKRVPFSQIAIM